MSIANNIRLYRKKAGLTQIQLADDMEISIATLRRWEAGETTPTGSRIEELAHRLDVSPEDIVASNEIKKQSDSASKVNNGMLVFENGGTRVELPPTEKGYEIFNQLVQQLIKK
ncbi:MAG: helix-turn-helix transcriptional regulator [Synergistales bacterium]|nr:helix-turn-helix transcriptional regulator [Synergistales bacterium]MDY6402113.1 helix-turn-helix transcriptional regulator [Synergistales bacterium]MDY6405226.1 helix-turn-helix transcriptional regulator [Synergistales bacterium]MDY6410616.1 helix-turn-helix transcriptional regulator [Synergistales bacterium]MDY6413889.1 helix-turn-helix transcriptional regulator [Synergistales bacterium]